MHDSSETLHSALIAVIGMAGRFPGARDINQFWRNLRDGVEGISFLSDDQLRASGVSAAELAAPDYVKAASVFAGVDLFDAGFFGFSPKDAAIMDPQHRHFLECSWEALENAGWSPDEFDGRIGVYAGSGMNSYLIHNLLANSQLVAETGIFALKQTGNDKDVLATRVSYQFGLNGPSLSVQTACSTSLVAIHLACQSLLNHECDMTLAGGVTIEIPHGHGYIYREGEILSQDGHCRAFDADSSGTIFGSGAGVVVLRRLEDAIKDGDFVHAIVRGTAINNDGARKVGFLAPSVSGQAEVIAEALAIAGVAPESISYIEAHGTGTTIGDPIEIRALTSAFAQSTDRKGYCAIGSLKTNIGHLDAAAGVAGFIKAVLALEHAQIPPSLNYSKPNPLIDFNNTPFFVNTRLRPWESNGHPRRAGVTALGIGGTNAHAILEEAPLTTSGDSRPWQLLTLSAKSSSAVDAECRNLARHLSENSTNLADAAYTCHVGRKGFGVRRAIVCCDLMDATNALLRPTSNRVISGIASEKGIPVVFLFSGQGAQYSGMGQGLYESEPEFRRIVDFCAEFLRTCLGIDLRNILFPPDQNAEEAEHRLNETRITQPALFVVEYAVAKLWQSWGVHPDAMIGHSIGEFAAAAVAGVFSLESGLEIVAERARLMQSMTPGTMMAVALPEDQLLPLLKNDVDLAGVNSDQQCVVSGLEHSIVEFESALVRMGIACQRLRVSHAFHSRVMDPVLIPFTEFLRKFNYSTPRIPFISSATGNWITESEASNPVYWARQLRDTVRFSDGVSRSLNKERALFLEVGPGRTLLSLAAQNNNLANSNDSEEIAPDHEFKTADNSRDLKNVAIRPDFVASLRSRQESSTDLEVILLAVGKLWVAGRRIDWHAFHAHERRKRLPLPTYPFEHKSFWIEPTPEFSKTQQLSSRAFEALPIVEQAPATETFFHPVWNRSDIDYNSSQRSMGPWLILRDSDRFGAEIAELGRRRGEHCIEVIPGERFARLSDNLFQINIATRSDYVKLIAELDKDGRIPSFIVHLWSITGKEAAPNELDSLVVSQNRNFYSLLFLAQALGLVDLEVSVSIGVVSNSLQSVKGEPIWHPERAVLFGPCGVIPKEFPNILCCSIDIAFPSQMCSWDNAPTEVLMEIGGQIFSEISQDSVEPVVAIRGEQRWVRRLEPLRQDRPKISLTDRGVYLITGGLGGIGLTLAQSLAQSACARLVLIGRSEFPKREEWAGRLRSHKFADPVVQKILAIQSIEKSGGEVLALTGDVSNVEDMNRVVATARERFGKIDGVIHAAGILEDALIPAKDAASASRVLAAKVKGTLVLELVLANDPPTFFILMSSISALIAPPGQIDYAAANSFLDTFATSRSSQGNLTMSIQWPRWSDVGMAASSSTNPKSVRNRVHPLLQNLVKGDEFEQIYESVLSLEKDWILSEHRLRQGAGMFPGTAYVEMVTAALDVSGRAGELSIRNLRFELPLTVEAGNPRAIRLQIRKLGRQHDFTVTESTDAEPGEWITCARGNLVSTEVSSMGFTDLAAIRKRCNVDELVFRADSQNAKQEKYISFGLRWRSLKKVLLGRREALSEVELPNEFANDLAIYRLHPAILDVATGSAMFLIPGYDQTEYLYVPVGYGEITIRGSLPAKCYAHIRARGNFSSTDVVATFDISILDDSGRSIAEIRDFTIQQIRDLHVLDRGRTKANRKVVSAHQSLPGYDLPPPLESISRLEGVQVFKRLLGGSYAANVTVSKTDLTILRAKSADRPALLNSRVPNDGENASYIDGIEATLTNWWRELLGLSEVGRHESFFEVGGQSLSVIRLMAKIKKAYGLELSPAVMFESPTIEGIARLIRAKEPPPLHSSVVSIRTQNVGPPLFLIHALGGRIIGYNDLLTHLNRKQSVCGVEFDYAASRPGQMRMEYLATHYIKEIRVVQPEGPYYLLGYSFGGLMAFEIALQLHDAGEKVAFLGMLDTWQTGHLRSLDEQQTPQGRMFRRAKSRLRHAKEILASRDPSNLKHEIRDRSLRFWDDLVGFGLRTAYSICGLLGCSVPRSWQRPQDVNWYALTRYTARQYPGRITLFRAEEGIGSVDSRYGEELGWNGLATLGVEVHKIPGGHLELLKEPNVGTLAQKLSLCLERCNASKTADLTNGHFASL
jgi:acyl transferase domain-containing protein/thioesterase domain-containing protein